MQLTCSFLLIEFGPGVLRKDAALDGPSAFSAEGGSSATISSSSLSSDVSAANGDACGLDMIIYVMNLASSWSLELCLFALG